MSLEQNISPQWIESQFRLWQRSPERFSPEWRAFFAGFALGQGEASPALDPGLILKQSAVESLLYRYRYLGHLLACTDPLNPCPTSHPYLDLAAFDLSETDLDHTFRVPGFQGEAITLRELLTVLRETYCRHVGVEFMHIQCPTERQWLIERMEPVRNRPALNLERRRGVLETLLEATRFEAFLHRRYLGQKRFSLEGGEVLIPVLQGLVHKARTLGVADLVLGMSHRGRLNVLVNIFHKPLPVLFAEFEDNLVYNFVGEGDVKYHKGFSTDLEVPGAGSIHLTMAANPSHLEAVNPVVEGKSRARQDDLGEGGEQRVLPVLIHGDAAFAGQGVVAETLNLSQLEGYRTGGTVHVVLNNQIGFTTTSEEGRSTQYATDMAKMLLVPIFHVNGEDPEAAVHAVELALAYRQAFAKDVVVEIVCYRRHGHNEGDEPSFTQPLMYDKIQLRPSVADLYAEKLREEGLPAEEVEALTRRIEDHLEQAVHSPQADTDSGFAGKWRGIRREWAALELASGVPAATLQDLQQRMNRLPEGFTAHPKVLKILEKRGETIAAGEEIDWGGAEILAYASLVAAGTKVRLSGQDVRRGTFGHRHAALVDIRTGAVHVPLNVVATAGGAFEVYNSLLSEAAVLGFEYGYSLENPQGLILWEAQFGDFANGAQVIIDQFIAGSATKWDRCSGLVLLLPHGYEGQGAEHSSARIERFLQLSADCNLQVVYPSTPAQLFHLLRRQVLQPFRRPLVVFTPKSLLRHPVCRSRLEEFATGGFREILPPLGDPEQVETVMLCSGKIYYDLLERQQQDDRRDVAIGRIEQLYPLRVDLLAVALAPFAQAREVLWVQEEPMNAGAWATLQPHLGQILGRSPRYIGRYAMAAPAVGSHRLHMEEQRSILDYAFGTIGKQS